MLKLSFQKKKKIQAKIKDSIDMHFGLFASLI